MNDFRLESPFRPAGDQPAAIGALVDGLRQGEAFQTLGDGDARSSQSFGAVRVAYALRWVELGDGRPRPPWPQLLEIGGA